MNTWRDNLESQMDLMGPDGAERLRGNQATPNVFQVLGVAAAAGRVFTDNDRAYDNVVVISDDLWRRRFGADPSIINGDITLAMGRPRRLQSFRVIGVLPAGFRYFFPDKTDIWITLPWETIQSNGALLYRAFARAADPVHFRRAQDQLLGIARDRAGTGSPTPAYVALEGFENRLRSQAGPGVVLLQVAAGLMFLIAAVNVSILVSAQVADRRSEFAVRLALGSRPLRIANQLAVEAALLAIVSVAAGILVARWCQVGLRDLTGAVFVRGDEASVDLFVIAVSAAMSVITIGLSTLLPAGLVLQWDVADSLRHGGRVVVDRKVAKVHKSIIGVQTALVMTLMVCAILLGRSLWKVTAVEPGYRLDGIVVSEVRLLNPKYDRAEARNSFEREVLSRLRQTPGIQLASVANSVPLRGVDISTSFGMKLRSVDPAYFEILGISLQAGRLLDDGDASQGRSVALVSRGLAQSLFGADSPIGRSLAADKTREIVGVVEDVRYQSLVSAPVAAYYIPREPAGNWLTVFLAKTDLPLTQVERALKGIVATVDSEQPVDEVVTLERLARRNVATQRLFATASGLFGLVAMLLLGTGLLGVLVRALSERRREIALRQALGATPWAIRFVVLRFAISPVSLGILVGGVASLAISRLLERFLFGVTGGDSSSYILAILVVTTVAGLAIALATRFGVDSGSHIRIQ